MRERERESARVRERRSVGRRDRAVDRDQWRGRRTGFVVIDRRRDLGSSSLAIDRDLDPVRDRAVDRFSSHARALSLSLSLIFRKCFEGKIEV